MAIHILARLSQRAQELRRALQEAADETGGDLSLDLASIAQDVGDVINRLTDLQREASPDHL